MTRGSRMVTGLAALVLLGGIPAAAQAPATGSARGIYLAGSALGVSTEIEFERDGKRGMVPPTFEFKSGDKFWLHVTTNRSAYVYILNRTIVGSPETAASRGIKLMQKEDATSTRPNPDAYTMIYPAPNTRPALVKAKATTRIPTDPSQFFSMDEVIGAEKVLVVATERPLDITKLFDPGTGRMARAGNTADSASSVLNRLNDELARMADNAVTEETPRSRDIRIKTLPAAPPPPAGNPITPVPPPPPVGSKAPEMAQGPGVPKEPEGTSVSVGKNPALPLLQELTLVHLAR